MKANDFIKNYVVVDNRTRISKKIDLLSKKYQEFSRYLELVQKEGVCKIFIILKKQNYLISSMLKDQVTNNYFRHYINVLLAGDFIELYNAGDYELSEVEDVIGVYATSKANFYRLTKKGKDFLSIDYIEEYLNKEYEELEDELF